MCSLHGGDSKEEGPSFLRVMSELESGRLHHSNVELSGGEPTVRDGFIEIVAEAKRLGYREIGISTNGRKLADKDFCDKAVKAGLNRVTFALHGASSEIHDAVTGVEGSFNEIIAGIKNVRDSGIDFGAASVLFSLNADNFPELGKFIFSMGANDWNIADLIPEGRSYEKYASMAVFPDKAAKILSDLLSQAEEYNLHIGLFNFSRCLLPESLPLNVFFVGTKKKIRDWNVKVPGQKEDNFMKEEDICESKFKSFLPVCTDCRYRDDCGGYWKRAIEMLGAEEADGLIRKAICLNRKEIS